MDYRTPKISVILCTYNRKNFLQRSVESIINQTFKDIELILINNGSTDGTAEICQKYALQDKRVKLINISCNQGPSPGRNKGLDKAKGDYITFVDDDDYCEPEMLEFLWNLKNNRNADIAICGSWYDYNGTKAPKYIYDEELVLDKVQGLDELLKREKYNVSPATKIYRRNLFDGIRFPSGVLVDDIHVIYKVFANANTIVAKGVPLYSFAKHGNNLTSFVQDSKLYPELLYEYITMYRERTKYLSERVPEIKPRSRYSEWSYMISMCNKIKTYKCDNCVEVYKWMINEIYKNIEEFWNSPFITSRERDLIKEHFGDNNLALEMN